MNLQRFLAAALIAAASLFASADSVEFKTWQVKVGAHPLKVELAASEPQRTQGLMFRKQLGHEDGMLFVFDDVGYHSMWMKNTLIPLDMIWMDSQHRIVHIAHDVQPCKADPCPNYPPNAQASSVLELAAGVAAERVRKSGAPYEFAASLKTDFVVASIVLRPVLRVSPFGLGVARIVC